MAAATVHRSWGKEITALGQVGENLAFIGLAHPVIQATQGRQVQNRCLEYWQ